MTEDEAAAEFRDIRARLSALQTLVTSFVVVAEKKGLDPRVVEEAFDFAIDSGTVAAYSSTDAVNAHAVRTLKILEDLRDSMVADKPTKKSV